MANQQVSERRRFRRYRVSVPVRFCVAGQDGLPSFEDGETVDISSGGCLVRCGDLAEEFIAQLIEEDYALELKLLLRERPWLDLRARVVWLEPHPKEGGSILRICFVAPQIEAVDRICEFLGGFTEPTESGTCFPVSKGR